MHLVQKLPLKMHAEHYLKVFPSGPVSGRVISRFFCVDFATPPARCKITAHDEKSSIRIVVYRSVKLSLHPVLVPYLLPYSLVPVYWGSVREKRFLVRLTSLFKNSRLTHFVSKRPLMVGAIPRAVKTDS